MRKSVSVVNLVIVDGEEEGKEEEEEEEKEGEEEEVCSGELEREGGRG